LPNYRNALFDDSLFADGSTAQAAKNG